MTPDPSAGSALAQLLDEYEREISLWTLSDDMGDKDGAAHHETKLRAARQRVEEAVRQLESAPQKCPICDGHGLLPYPEGVAYGMGFTSSSAGPWPCHFCKGAKVVGGGVRAPQEKPAPEAP